MNSALPDDIYVKEVKQVDSIFIVDMIVLANAIDIKCIKLNIRIHLKVD